MADTLGERRAEPRLPATALEIERATLRPGCLVAVLDLSASGAQVQARAVVTNSSTSSAAKEVGYLRASSRP